MRDLRELGLDFFDRERRRKTNLWITDGIDNFQEKTKSFWERNEKMFVVLGVMLTGLIAIWPWIKTTIFGVHGG